MDVSSQSYQGRRAGPDALNSDVVRNDETIETRSEFMDGEQIESDSDQMRAIVSFSTARS